MARRHIYEFIASKLGAIESCRRFENWQWCFLHREAIEQMVMGEMPSGSGFDSGTQLDFDRSTPEKLVFTTAYHHMNEGGFYDGWSHHTVTVKPSLNGRFKLSIGGRDRDGIKDYIAEVFHSALVTMTED